MRALPQMLRLDGDERPRQELSKVASLYFGQTGDNLYGEITTETEAYFRRLATAADELADAVGAAVADQKSSTEGEASP